MNYKCLPQHGLGLCICKCCYTQPCDCKVEQSTEVADPCLCWILFFKGLTLKESFVLWQVWGPSKLRFIIAPPLPLSFLVIFFKCLWLPLDKKTFEAESCGGSRWEGAGYFESSDSEVPFTKELSVGFWHCKCFVCLQVSSWWMGKVFIDLQCPHCSQPAREWGGTIMNLSTMHIYMQLLNF